MRNSVLENIDAPSHIVSLLKICPEELYLPIYELCQVMPKTIRMSEAAIRKKIKPTQTLDRLRLAFWDQVNMSIMTDKRIRLNKFIRGCCSRRQFLECYISDRKGLLWLITPPKSYSLAMRKILASSVDTLDELVKTPISEHLETPAGLRKIDLILRLFEINWHNGKI